MDGGPLTQPIVEAFETLSPQLQAAARYVLDKPNDVALLSMREQARHAGVPPATMTRLAQRLGLDGYDQVRALYAGAVRTGALGFAGRAGVQVEAQKLRGEKALAAELAQSLSRQIERMAEPAALERLANALRKVTVLARGPKPLPVLRELGVKADILVPEPNTWREIVASIAARPERRILVQEYGRSNAELTAALEGMGARVTPLVVYQWALPEDCEPLREAARQLAGRAFDVVMFTSSIQLEHLLKIAREQSVEGLVIDALRHYTAVASVGPVMSDSLRAAGLPVDIEPVHPKMAPLTKAVLEMTASIVAGKRGRDGAA